MSKVTLVIAISFTLAAAAQNTNAPPNAQTITQSAGTYDELKRLLTRVRSLRATGLRRPR